MNRKTALRTMASFTYFTAAFLWLFSGAALAYIDPAATSYMIQIVAGIVITCGVMFGVFWKKIALFFRSLQMKFLKRKISKEHQKAQEKGQ